MNRRALATVAVVVAVVAASGTAWLTISMRQRASRAALTSSTASDNSPTTTGRKIKARLYYVSTDGTKLTGVDREVPYVDGAAAQAQQIVSAQLAAPAAPLLSAMPPGTALRAVYLDDKGDAFVDLSKEVSSAHTGGSQNELLTIYTIVNTLTASLPAITSVQILVDGKEVDTLAGHIDLRKPLQKNLAIIEPENNNR